MHTSHRITIASDAYSICLLSNQIYNPLVSEEEEDTSKYQDGMLYEEEIPLHTIKAHDFVTAFNVVPCQKAAQHELLFKHLCLLVLS